MIKLIQATGNYLFIIPNSNKISIYIVYNRISVIGLTTFKPGKQLELKGKKEDGTTYSFPLNHTFNENQINWFKNGSALNAMAKQLESI